MVKTSIMAGTARLRGTGVSPVTDWAVWGCLAMPSWWTQSSQNGQIFCVIAGAGSEFSLQAALAPGRLKPELQTGHATKLSWHGRLARDW